MTHTAGAASTASFAAIVPARNAASTLESCLGAIRNSRSEPSEVWVYDDASNDDTAKIATRAGVALLRGGSIAVGPGAGRYECARNSMADILVFIDADVSIHADAISFLLQEIYNDPKCVAAFGSYDDRPACSHFAAKYANLRHHYFHQVSSRDASTFWTGFGAVRRNAFLAVSGFDRKYDRPSIEDVELGTRLIAAGDRIRLVPLAQATHHKNWTLRQLWQTDILQRALPWSELVCSGLIDPSALNTSREEKIRAVLAHMVWIGLLARLLATVPATLPVALLVGYLGMNLGIYRLFWKSGGYMVLLLGVVLHWLYHLYASATFSIVKARFVMRGIFGRLNWHVPDRTPGA
jgi:glycosyltransferase involved in cell wall biosynthesis